MEEMEAYLMGYTLGDGNLYNRSRKSSLNPRKTLTSYEIVWGDKDIQQLKIIKEILKSKFPLVSVCLKFRKNSKGKILKISGRKQVELFKRRINFLNPNKCAKLEKILSRSKQP